MKKSTRKKLAVIVSIAMVLAPTRVKGIEYKTLPEEPIKVEEPIVKRRVK